MSTPTEFLRFMSLPPELRQLVWQQAVPTKPMRLHMTEHHKFTHAKFHLPNKWRPHVAQRQRERCAFYTASRESRYECMKRFTKISTSSINLFITKNDIDAMEAGRASPSWYMGSPASRFKTLLVDWSIDLIYMSLFPHRRYRSVNQIYVSTMMGYHVTRLVVSCKKVYNIFVSTVRESERRTSMQDFFNLFKSLEEVILVRPGDENRVHVHWNRADTNLTWYISSLGCTEGDPLMITSDAW
ncbi:hypothetical protein G7054_g6892 [Neopestalotiopsis clavispora]|nr:hypothetical protein G7054_g6892 [Neopestalotiopsis clavispora]